MFLTRHIPLVSLGFDSIKPSFRVRVAKVEREYGI